MTSSRNINRKRYKWLPEYVELVRRNYADSRTDDIAAALGVRVDQVYRLACRLGLRKSEEWLNGTEADRLTGEVGSISRFKPGHKTWNKGMRGLQLSPATQFKPGHTTANRMPLGALRVNSEGYLDRKVAATGYAPRDWQAVHRLVWIEANGPVPDGHVVVFKAGRRGTDVAAITLDALELVTQAELMRRNSVHRYGPEIAHVSQLRAAITRQINQRTKDKEAA